MGEFYIFTIPTFEDETNTLFRSVAGNYATKGRHTAEGQKTPKHLRVNTKQLSGEALFLFQTVCFWMRHF